MAGSVLVHEMITRVRRWGSTTLLAFVVGACGTARQAQDDEEVPSRDPLQEYCGAASSDVEARITEVLEQLSVDEKVRMMHGASLLAVDGVWLVEGHEALEVPGLHMLDGPRGVSKVAGVQATAFPVPMLRGATWDPALEREVGAAMAREIRSVGADVLLAPTLNILRHPRWGRAQETYGEDVHHLGIMGAAFIEGVQSQRVLATVKHYAVNSIEDTRFEVDVTVDERTLREIYLPHFRRAVVQARVGAVMSAYNSVNGAYCDLNEHLLTEILREDWQFQGFVMSDWVLGTHANVASVRAGLDLEMPSGRHFSGLVAAVERGPLAEAELDASLRRNLRGRFCFGLDVDPPVRDPSRRGTPEHLALSLEVARRGIVVLRNEGVLPIDRTVAREVVVMGPLADLANIGDGGSSDVDPVEVVTTLAGMRDRAGSVHVTHLEAIELGPDEEAAIMAADAVVLVAGLTDEDEGEGLIATGDRRSLALAPEQDALIAATAALATPTIVVLQAGASLVISEWVGSVDAVLMAWYPGSAGGYAIADVVFGDTEPSGRLPVSFPMAEADLPEFDNTSLFVSYDFLHGYRHLQDRQVPALFPFGHGLGYATFGYGDLRVEPARVRAGETFTVEVDVTNESERAGIEIVQLYVSAPQSRVARAPRDLRAFARVELAPHSTRTVTLELDTDDLAYYDTEAAAWIIEPLDYLVEVGRSSEDLRLSTTVTID
jgi:beta-glucosidase